MISIDTSWVCIRVCPATTAVQFTPGNVCTTSCACELLAVDATKKPATTGTPSKAAHLRLNLTAASHSAWNVVPPAERFRALIERVPNDPQSLGGSYQGMPGSATLCRVQP